MPYVPSKKTDGKSEDREVLDVAVEMVATDSANRIVSNFSLISVYGNVFSDVVRTLLVLSTGEIPKCVSFAERLARRIFNVASPYNYEGAFLGELNYAMTRFIQRVPQIKVERGEWKDELRYWLYAATVESLTKTAADHRNSGCGIGGVFEDIKDEYKRRVNTAYEGEQIVKSGDCYDTPWYTRVVPVEDEDGNAVGRMEVMLKRSKETLDKDVLDYVLVLKKKK